MTSETNKFILGISAYFHDSAAALVQGDKIIAAVQEERFTRKKADWHFPEKAIEYCLSQLPDGAELEAIAYYEDPSLKIDRIMRNAVTQAPRGTLIWDKTLQALNTLNKTLPARLLEVMPDAERIYFTAHHRSHAASAFYPSPFKEAAILVTDGVGEWTCSSIWHGAESSISAVSETRFPNSTGMLYSAFTQYCGFKVNSGEYKLMGLAPFGQPIFKNLIYENLVEVQDDGDIQLNMDYFDFDAGPTTISPLFHRLLNFPPRKPNEPITPHYMNVSASIQEVLNDIMVLRAKTALRLTQSEYLCMAGGVALNCVTNSEIARRVKSLKGIWVQPAAGDAGAALGAALDISHRINNIPNISYSKNTDGMQFSCLGPAYTATEIEGAIEQHGLVYETYINDQNGLEDVITDALVGGQIVGYFDGRLEFGPRALGNRSILADPRPTNMLQHANKKIKFRETWRPLAPIVLEEYENQLFHSHGSDPYMVFVSELKEEFRTQPDLKILRDSEPSDLTRYLSHTTSSYPAVTHCDYSARTQSLSKQANPKLHSIITKFHEQTECPMLLNTSFNVRGEPMVCSPDDAIKTFLNTHIDVLAIGPFFIRRISQDKSINALIGKRRFRED